jgi:hypothetical protein
VCKPEFTFYPKIKLPITCKVENSRKYEKTSRENDKGSSLSSATEKAAFLVLRVPPSLWNYTVGV